MTPGPGPAGCSPLDQISKNEFQTITQSDFCKGLEEEDFNQSVLDYLHGQGVDKSALLDAAYQEITNHPALDEMDVKNPKVAQMVYLACYNLDRFKAFVFESSFLEKFEVEEERLEKIKTDQDRASQIRLSTGSSSACLPKRR